MSRSRYVALLRGINVGKAKRIAMADLKALYESLGLSDVRTLLNSGNVVFTALKAPKKAADLAAALETATAAKLGVTSRVTLVAAAELDAIVGANPLLAVATDPSRLLVAVLRDPTDRPRLEALAKQAGAGAELALGTGPAHRAAYLWCPDGLLKAPLAEALLTKLGDAVTTRNWATILKLHALTQEAAKP